MNEDIFCGIDWSKINAELEAERNERIARETSAEWNSKDRPLHQRHSAQRWSTDAERSAWKQEAAAEIAPLAEQKVNDFHDFVDNLTDEDIAMLDRMTRETDRQDDYDSRSEGGWM